MAAVSFFDEHVRVSRAANDHLAYPWEVAKFDPSQNQNPLSDWDEIWNIRVRPGYIGLPGIKFVKIGLVGASG